MEWASDAGMVAKATSPESAVPIIPTTGVSPLCVSRSRKPLSPARQPAMNRADRTAQAASRLLRAEALQQAQHDRLSIPLRQAAQLFVENFSKVIQNRLVRRLGRFSVCQSLVPPSPHHSRPRAARRAVRDLMEPGTQRIAHPQAPGLLTRTKNVAWKAS